MLLHYLRKLKGYFCGAWAAPVLGPPIIIIVVVLRGDLKVVVGLGLKSLLIHPF